jgi:hypothetical protein
MLHKCYRYYAARQRPSSAFTSALCREEYAITLAEADERHSLDNFNYKTSHLTPGKATVKCDVTFMAPLSVSEQKDPYQSINSRRRDQARSEGMFSPDFNERTMRK